MKRGTGFKRRQIERRPSPPPTRGRGGVMARIAGPAAPVLKDEPLRSEAYRRAVASLPCVICGIAGYSQAAHGSEGKGMGIKASDLELFPACCDRPGVRGCHPQLDQGALFSKAVRRELEPVWSADTRRRILAMGQWPKNLPLPAEAQANETGVIEG